MGLSINWINNKLGYCAKLGVFGRDQHSWLPLVFYISLGYDMADKEFFKGRQDARKNHVEAGFKTRGSVKTGTKKYPLVLTVISEARKQEVEALAAEAKLYAEVSIDGTEGAVESIAALTALLNKPSTIVLDKVPTRNEPCVCGSGKKYKKCCG